MKKSNIKENITQLLEITDKYYKKVVDEVVFINLKEEKTLSVGEVILTSEIPLPIYLDKIVSRVNKKSVDEFEVDEIVDGMIYMLGVDSTFSYNADYITFLKAFNPEIVQYILQKGIKDAIEEKFMLASVYFRAVLAIEPLNVDALYNLARCFEDLYKKHDDRIEFSNLAFELFTILLELDENFNLSRYHIGFHYININNHKKAKEIWVEALKGELDKDKSIEVVDVLKKIDHEIEFERGFELILNQRVEEGLEILKSLEKEHNDWWKLMFFIGLGHRMMEEYDDAIRYFNRSLALNTGHIESLNEIGISYMSMGRYNDALDHLKEATRLHPNNAELMCNLGIVYLNLGNKEEALDLIELAHDIDPEDEIVLAWLDHLKNNG